jgi:hypothetical protein
MGSQSVFPMGSWAIQKLGLSLHCFVCRPKVSLTVDAYSHLNIGAGRIVWQDIVRIDVAIKKRQFHKNDVILESFKRAKDTNGRLHLLGLVRNPTSSLPRCSLIHRGTHHVVTPLDIGWRRPLS